MVTTEQQAPGRASVAQRWLARLALVAAGAVASIGTVSDSFNNALAESVIGLDRTARSRRAPMPTNEDSPTRSRHRARMVDRP
jgi:hypothetical protein